MLAFDKAPWGICRSCALGHSFATASEMKQSSSTAIKRSIVGGKVGWLSRASLLDQHLTMNEPRISYKINKLAIDPMTKLIVCHHKKYEEAIDSELTSSGAIVHDREYDCDINLKIKEEQPVYHLPPSCLFLRTEQT